MSAATAKKMAELATERDPARALVLIADICAGSHDAMHASIYARTSPPVMHGAVMAQIDPYIEQLREHLTRTWTARCFERLELEARAAALDELGVGEPTGATDRSPAAEGGECICGGSFVAHTDYSGAQLGTVFCKSCGVHVPLQGFKR